MISSDSILFIYDHLTSERVCSDGTIDADKNGYYILYHIDNKNELDNELFSQTLKEMNNSDISIGRNIGPFNDLTDLRRYSFLLCQKLNRQQVCLVSVKEFNSVIGEVRDSEQLVHSLLEVGSSIENVEKKKNGLLNKLFR